MDLWSDFLFTEDVPLPFGGSWVFLVVMDSDDVYAFLAVSTLLLLLLQDAHSVWGQWIWRWLLPLQASWCPG